MVMVMMMKAFYLIANRRRITHTTPTLERDHGSLDNGPLFQGYFLARNFQTNSFVCLTIIRHSKKEILPLRKIILDRFSCNQQQK